MESDEFLESLGPGPTTVLESRRAGLWRAEQVGDIDKWEATFRGRVLPVYFKSKELALIALLEIAITTE